MYSVNSLSKAKQSKAKQSKAKQSKAIIIFFIFILFIFNSCSDELITIVDEYNPPYEVKAIPGSNSISINFWSGVLANDFAGFNLYISDTQTFTNAVGYPSLPTIPYDTHTRTNITLTFPTSANIQNNQLYYVGVTAYGTNDLADGGKIETKVNAIPVVPRAETTVTTTTITANSITINIDTTSVVEVTATGNNNPRLKSYGVQTNFNAITVFTNDNISGTSAPYLVGELYIASNNTDLVKIWIPSSGNYIYATNYRADVCSTI